MSQNKTLKYSKGTVKRLLKMIYDFFPRLLPLIVVLILINAVISAMPSVFMQKVIAVIQDAWENHLSWEEAKPRIYSNVGVLVGLYICSLIAGFAFNQLMAILTQGTLARLRDTMFRHMESLPIAYFDRHKRGDIMSYYTNDVDAMRQMISQSFPQLLVSLISITTILCIMMYYSIWMGLVIVLGSMVSVIITRVVGGKSAYYFMAQQKYVAAAEGVVEEMINGGKVIKVFNHEEEAEEAFDAANEELFQAAYNANRYSNTLMPILNNVSYLIYVLVAVTGGLLIEHNVTNVSFSGLPISIAVVVPFLGMSRQFAGMIQQISPQINSIVMGLAGAERIFAMLDEEPETDNGYVTLVHATEKNGVLEETDERTELYAWKHPHQADGTITYAKVRGDIRFFDVDFAYVPGKTILHNITLYGKPGQKIAFVGATGAGKTTITNLINRFYDLEDGKIRYDDININKIKKSALRKSLGIILQETVLFTGTVMENIRYGRLDATDEECIAAAKLAGADSFIRHLPQGYQTMLDGDGSNLSQGQCQLLAIARAAVADPPVMIMDEATSSIDTRTEQIVQRGMDALMAGRTVFVIAHRLSTVKNSNVILVLDHGRVIERGTHDELIAKKGQYYQLYTGAFELE
ncbi:MAG: ABC transporter ATP-binding protein [Solobacterium sp.]|nr:ABC transporter ATP-binding protein [Solobacterium sp.]